MVGCDSMDSVLRLERTLRPENRGKIVSPRQEALQSLSSSQQLTQRALTTDAEGRYRIFGLPPGTYIVSTMIAMDHGSERVVAERWKQHCIAGLMPGNAICIPR